MKYNKHKAKYWCGELSYHKCIHCRGFYLRGRGSYIAVELFAFIPSQEKNDKNIHFNASKKKCVKRYAIGCNELYGFIYSCAGSYIRFVFCSR